MADASNGYLLDVVIDLSGRSDSENGSGGRAIKVFVKMLNNAMT